MSENDLIVAEVLPLPAQSVTGNARAPNLSSLAMKLFSGCVALAVHLFVLVVVMLFLFKIVPNYQRLFWEENTVLAAVTELYILFSSMAGRYWYLLALGFLVLEVPLAFALQFLPPHWRWIKGLWFNGYLLAAFCFLLLGGVAMYMPIYEMLSKAPGNQ